MNYIKNMGDTIYGKQHVVIIDNNNKIIRDEWITARIYEKDEIIRLELIKDLKVNSGENITLGEFKPYNNG